MQLDLGKMADPDRLGAVRALVVALSLFVFAYSTQFGKVPILLLYALWLPMLALPARRIWSDLHRPALILALPLLALASILWSDRPEVTLRAALQYGSTVLLGLVAARVIALRDLGFGLVIGGIAVLLYSHAQGQYAYDVVDGSYAFSGAFSSKNQLGLYASLVLIAGVGTLHYPRPGLWRALLAGLMIGFAGWTILLTESATAVITAVLAVGAMLVVGGLMRLGLMIRSGTVVTLFVLIGLGATAALQFGTLDSVLGAFGKDSTLTGRTYLWSRGIEIGRHAAPWGLGYNAFWVPGRATAEELWTEFHIPNFTGFHFHNTLIEGFVGLGQAGLALLITWLIGLPILTVWTLLVTGQDARRDRGDATLLAGLSLLFLIRAFVEIDFFTPYTVGSFMVPFLLLVMADRIGWQRGLAAARLPRGTLSAAQKGPEPDLPLSAFAFGSGVQPPDGPHPNDL